MYGPFVHSKVYAYAVLSFHNVSKSDHSCINVGTLVVVANVLSN